jgi:hypothetical protein
VCKAAAAYLRERRTQRVTEAYRRGYGETCGIGQKLDGREAQGQWPEE